MTKYKRKKKGLTEKRKMKERKEAHYRGILMYITPEIKRK